MPEETNNPFRQVALVLISLTIIVLGIVFNQAASKSDGTTTSSTSRPITSYLPQPDRSSAAVSNQDNTGTTTMGTSTQTNQNSNLTTNPAATTNNTTSPTPSTNNLSPTVNILPDQLDTLRRQEFNVAMNYLAESLTPLQQLLALVTAPTFAETAVNFNLPGTNQLALAIPTTGGTIPFPAIGTQPTTPSASVIIPTTSTPEEIPLWKQLTGYARWEELKQNFRAAQQKYAGTGQCMVNMRVLGCLVTW